METIVVTGASRGIGAEAAVRLSEAGHRVVLVARSEDALRATARRCAGPAPILPADLARDHAADALCSELSKRGWLPSGWVLNAGVSNDRPFGAAAPEAVERELRLNYLTPMHLLRLDLPRLRSLPKARVTVVASLTSVVPFPGNATYAASKAALFSLVRSLRLELRGSRVSVGAVLPGYTETAMSRSMDSRWVRPMSAEAVGRRVARAHLDRAGLHVPGLLNRAALRTFARFPLMAEQLLRLPGLVVSGDHDSA